MSIKLRESDYGITALVLFLFQPFFGFLRACGRLNDKTCGLVVMLFYGLFGYAHSFLDVRVDAYRKAAAFAHYRSHSFSEIWDLYSRGELTDPTEFMIYEFVSRFTHNPHIMMGIVGLLGSFFIVLTLRKIVGNYKYPKSLTTIILIYLLVISFSPVAIGGIRSYLSNGLVIYSTLKIIFDKRYLWFIGLAIAPLIHFSALLWLPIVLIYTMVKIPKSFLFWAAISACIFGNVLETSGYQKVVSSVVDEYGSENKAIAGKANFYSSKYGEKIFNKSKTTHITKFNKLINSGYLIFMLFVIRKKLRKLNYPPELSKIWYAMLYFMTFGYLASGFSVVGSRYLLLFGPLSILLFLRMYVTFPEWKTLKTLILWKFIFTAVNSALVLYNMWCVEYHEMFWAPLPVIIERGLSY